MSRQLPLKRQFVILEVPKRRGYATLCGATQGSAWLGQAEGARGNVGIYCIFRIDWIEQFQWALGHRGCPCCLVLGLEVIRAGVTQSMRAQ